MHSCELLGTVLTHFSQRYPSIPTDTKVPKGSSQKDSNSASGVKSGEIADGNQLHGGAGGGSGGKKVPCNAPPGGGHSDGNGGRGGGGDGETKKKEEVSEVHGSGKTPIKECVRMAAFLEFGWALLHVLRDVGEF